MVNRYSSKNKIRIVTAASLFDGHDAAINVMRRVLMAGGAEVIHLGHNRSVLDVVTAAVQEDAQAIALSSYQGGHMEYFRYMRKLLDEADSQHIKIFGGGGGVIVPREIEALEQGIAERIYSPEDGRNMGLTGMIDDLLQRSDFNPVTVAPVQLAQLQSGTNAAVARAISMAEQDLSAEGAVSASFRAAMNTAAADSSIPVLGITGTGGAGKSSLTDELLRRYVLDFPEDRVAVISVDPTRKRTGGALLGDRIRMNSIVPDRVFMRSMATRDQKGELSGAMKEAIAICKIASFDLIIVETSGIGQGDTDITELSDATVYVMTPEYGASSQLEKIDMLDYADLIAINKFEKRGALDAFRDVRKQVRRNRELWEIEDTLLPVYGTVASRFADEGVNALYLGVLATLRDKSERPYPSRLPVPAQKYSPSQKDVIGSGRERYLGDVSRAVREYHGRTGEQIEVARRRQGIQIAAGEMAGTPAEEALLQRLKTVSSGLEPLSMQTLEQWEQTRADWSGDEFVYQVRGRDVRQPLTRESLSKQKIPRVVLPNTGDHGEILKFCRKENVPGRFPYTAGVFPLKRMDELPKRMFAGEGGPARTNKRFHLLCEGETAHRLSTAFDSVTLYGEDPHERPDIYGKVGESGVSVPHLDDMKILYGGFDLCASNTSVSMTINGPAPILLAMFLNTAIDQQVDQWTEKEGRAPNSEEYATLREQALHRVRGTVQADILKEDQAQNTCIFSTGFALKMMGDIQEYFIENRVKNFYSVSISGYHIAEAGANPISQLAFTLANGFTIVESYLARGMSIDDFGPNLSFFFSNGLDPEYAVIGRVARRIWSVAMRDVYGAGERAQKLKYHIQTSGRSLHAREIQFNDIRTTLQALLAINDNCNSLHTNAYDEAITTPTDESVRRAMAIQLIIAKEFGQTFNENPLQGSYFIEFLTDLVEEAVLQEFDRLNERGGVLGAMERQYQRTQIQEESMYYEHRKHSGDLPIIGINTYIDASKGDEEASSTELRRATAQEKQAQIDSVRRFQAAHDDESAAALANLQKVALQGGNLFAELMKTVRVASLGQISDALYAVGGEYRRNL